MSHDYTFNIRLKSQRSRSQGHKVQKRNSFKCDRVAGMSLRCTPLSAGFLICLSFVLFIIYSTIMVIGWKSSVENDQINNVPSFY